MKKTKTILLVEDEKALIDAITHKLERCKFLVASALTVSQAVNYLKELPSVDAIWLDHYLVGPENGLDLVSKLKEPNSKWSNIPIFVVSNTATPEKVNSYLKAGVNGYYVKSDSRLDQIVGEIKSCLSV